MRTTKGNFAGKAKIPRLETTADANKSVVQTREREQHPDNIKYSGKKVGSIRYVYVPLPCSSDVLRIQITVPHPLE